MRDCLGRKCSSFFTEPVSRGQRRYFISDMITNSTNSLHKQMLAWKHAESLHPWTLLGDGLALADRSTSGKHKHTRFMRINHVLIIRTRTHSYPRGVFIKTLMDRVIIIYRVSLHVSLMFQHILGSGRKYIHWSFGLYVVHLYWFSYAVGIYYSICFSYPTAKFLTK